jgi:uncharacterized protein
MEFDIHFRVLLAVFVIALLAGATMARTNFCTMGAVSDWMNMGDTSRLRSWLLAVAVASGGVVILELAGVINLGSTMPPYRTPQFAWLRYLLGGFLFGVGMTLGSGCATKTLIRIGGGNLKSVLVAVAISAVGYLMFTTEFFNVAVMSWLAPTIADLSAYGVQGQNADALLSHATGAEPRLARALAGTVIVGALLVFVFRSADFRGNLELVIGGAAVGLAVIAGWFITGGPFGEEWREHAMFAAERPSRVEVQSYTFISPIGDTGRYLLEPTRLSQLNFGIMGVFGVIAGSFLYAIASRTFRVEWFVSFRDFVNHLVGGLLMGFGGFLAMGCTIGQGVTGTSTLAVGSFLALAAMIAGGAVAMKVQYALLDAEG